MCKITCVVLYVGLLAVEGSLSELDVHKDHPPVRIGAFNIQIFGGTKFNKPEVAQELVKILSRYDIVLVQEIRDSSETYIHRLVEEVNKSTRSDEPLSLVVSERLGRSFSKEQYAFLYREKFVNKVDVYQYPDLQDTFERPPYAVKFRSDVLDMHEFGIIGLHTKPEDAFKEIDALDVVYDEVEKVFNTPHSKMATLSVRKDTSYTWLIKDAVDTTVSGTDCAYDRFIVKGNSWLDHISPNSVGIFHYDNEHQLSADLASDVSDHYPIEMEILGKCNKALLTKTPSFTVTVEDERVIPSENLKYIRYIYQKADEKIPTWNVQVYKIDTKMNYVKATKKNVDVKKAIEDMPLYGSCWRDLGASESRIYTAWIHVPSLLLI